MSRGETVRWGRGERCRGRQRQGMSGVKRNEVGTTRVYGARARWMLNVVPLSVAAACIAVACLQLWSAVQAEDARIAAAVMRQVEQRQQVLTEIAAVTSVLADNLEAIRRHAAGEVAAGTIVPLDCDTVSIADMQSIRRHAAGSFHQASISDGEQACLYYLMRSLLEGHRHGAVAELRIHLRDGVFSYPTAAADADMNAVFGHLRTLMNDGAGRRLKGSKRTMLLIPPGHPLVGGDATAGLAALVSSGRSWDALVVVKASPSTWGPMPVHDGLPHGALALLNHIGQPVALYTAPGLPKIVVADEWVDLAADDGRVHHDSGRVVFSVPLDDDLRLIWVATIGEYLASVSDRLDGGIVILLVIALSMLYVRGWTLRHVLDPIQMLIRQLSASTTDLTLMVDTMPDAMCMVTASGIISTMNEEMGRVLGLEKPEWGRHYSRYPVLRDIGHLIDRHDVSDWTGPELDMLLAGGRWVEMRLRKDLTSGTTSIILVDVTARKQSELQEREARQMAQRALDDLAGAKERLVESEKIQALSVLVAGLSHEVKTPLGTAVTASTTLQDRIGKLELSAKGEAMTEAEFFGFIADAKRIAAITVESLTRATALMQNFKAVSVQHSTDEDRVLDMAAWLSDVLPSLDIEARQAGKSLTTEIQAGLWITANPMHLWQVVQNLTTNALVHGYAPGQSGAIHIRARRIGHQIEISIADDGRGIAPDVIRHIFEPFFTTRRSAGGTGLGLAIVHNIVTQSLKGEIRAYSGEAEGQRGSRFVVRMPAAQAGGTA